MTFRELFGIDLPIIQAPMAGVQGSQLTMAQGKGDFSPLWTGQNPTGCREIPAADLTHVLCEGLDESELMRTQASRRGTV